MLEVSQHPMLGSGKLRIGIDLRCLEEEKISGVGEYALEIVRNLLEIDPKNSYVIFSNSYKQKSKNFDFLEKYPNVCLKRFRYPNKLLNFLIWYLGWPKLDKMAGGTDVFFAPNINFLSVSKNCRLITTFHDLSYERYPEFFARKTRLWHNWFVNPRRIARKSQKIIAVSESTQKDLKEVYKINPKKIKVIPHGVSDDFKTIDRNNPKLLEIQKKYNLPYKFILYLGNIESRKNIFSLVAAYKLLARKNPEIGKKYKLVLAGNKSSHCRGAMKEEKDITFCGYVKRKDRPFIYNLASLFVYPSHFEGFGLPLLEAMACGTPVITSNNSSIPEVVGKAGILVDPNRPEEIVQAVRAVLLEKKLHQTMKERGLKQAKKFSWKKAAEETLKLLTNYQSVQIYE